MDTLQTVAQLGVRVVIEGVQIAANRAREDDGILAIRVG